MVNQTTAIEPEVVEQSPDGPVTIIRYPIKEPGKGGFESGQGVFLSVVVGCILTFAWRWRGSVQISAPLLAQFALRGSTLALAMAILLELLGEAALSDVGIGTKEGFTFGNVCMMLIVGASEESTKLLAVFFGIWVSKAALVNSGQKGSCWGALVESPRALMLAGFAVGFGFMVNENAEYMIAVVSTPPMHYSTESADDEMVGAAALLLMSVLTICVRVLLNIHPWWAALSAGRLARVVFRDGRATAWPGCFEFMVAVIPSSLSHAFYDFLVGVDVPGVISMAIPLVFWLMARWAFFVAWDSYEEPQTRPVPVEGRIVKAPEGKALQSNNINAKTRRGSAAPSQKKAKP